ncbi:MAG: ComF family protein [Alcanivoracaceae bacterium]
MAVNLEVFARVYRWLIIDRNMAFCCACGAEAPAASALCADCRNDMARPAATTLCRCALPLPGEPPPVDDELAPLCGRCLDDPPPYLGMQAALLYQPPVSRMINRWKHHGRLYLQRPLTHLLLSEIPHLPDVDCVVPVPLHWRGQWQRGFNQAAVLANALAKQHGLPFADLLRRPRGGDHQQGHTAQQRRQARKSTFRCDTNLAGRRILLVDDVITTGSTARAASHALLDAGAHSVSVIALCRVPAPGK